jgi:hypothetical protein
VRSITANRLISGGCHSSVPLGALLLGWWIVVSVALSTSDSLLRGVLISATATAILLPLVSRLARGPLDVFEPIVPASLALCVMFVARPIADQITSHYSHIGYDIGATFDDALSTVFVGCLAFSIGYLSNVGRSFLRMFPKSSATFPQRKVVSAAIAIAALGTGVYGFFLFTHGGTAALSVFLSGRSKSKFDLERGSSGYLYATVYFLTPATAMLFAAWMRFRRTYLLALAALVGIPICAYEMAQGDRSQMLPLVFGLPMIYYLYKRRRPTLIHLCLAAGVILASFAFLREARNSDSIARKDIGAVLSDGPGAMFADTFLKDDNEMFDALANVISVVPARIPYQPLGLITDLGIRALPRLWYPDKPLEAGDQVIVALWPMHYRYSRASAAFSLFGNVYLYGGVIGVALGAFVFGAFLNQLWNWFVAQADNMNAILLYAFVPSFVVIALRGTVPDTLTRMFYTVLPTLLAQSYWRKKVR